MSLKPRDANLDLAKTIAILGVVFLHISDGYLLRSDYFGSSFIWYGLFFLRVLSGASVPIFIMLSGYLTLGKNYTYQQQFSRILSRLLIPFIFLFLSTIWMMGMSAAQLYNSVLHTPMPAVSTLLLKALTAPGGLHFLVALIGLNLLFPVWNLVFAPVEDNRNLIVAKYLIVGGFLVALTASLNLIFNPNLSGEVLNEWRWLLWVGYFLLGHYLKIKKCQTKIGWYLFTVGLVASLLVCFFTRQWLIRYAGQPLLAGLADFSLSYHSPWVVMMSIGSFVLLLNGSFSFLQRAFWQKIVTIGASLSLGIYIFHGLVFSYLDVFKRLGLDNMLVWRRPALAVIGLTSLVFVISAGVTFLFGLVPAVRMLIGNDRPWPFLPQKAHHTTES